MGKVLEFIFAFCASIAFGTILNSPRKVLLYDGLIGGIGWIVYKAIILQHLPIIMSALIASLIIGLLSGIFSIVLKVPTILLYLPSLIPLVPGGGMYYTMYALIMQDMASFGSKAMETSLIAIALAAGVFIATTLINILHSMFKNIKSKNRPT